MNKLYGETIRPQSGAAQAIQVRYDQRLMSNLQLTSVFQQSIVKETIEQSPVLSSRVKEIETKVKTEIDSFKVLMKILLR